MTRGEAHAILATGDFDEFLDVTEDLEVEFKRAPYRIDEDSERFELAKDVSAMANANGGTIIIGVHAESTAESAVDVVTRIRPLARGLVDETQYASIVTERVYPRLRELEIRFFPTAIDTDRGLVAIIVPPQEEVDKYFLIQRPLGAEGRTPGWLVGIAVRSIGRVDQQRIGEIHTLINRGFTVGRELGGISSTLAAVHELLAHGAIPGAPDTPADRLEAVIAARLEELEG